MKSAQTIFSCLALVALSFGFMACDAHKWEDTKVLNEGMNKNTHHDSHSDAHAEEAHKGAEEAKPQADH